MQQNIAKTVCPNKIKPVSKSMTRSLGLRITAECVQWPSARMKFTKLRQRPSSPLDISGLWVKPSKVLGVTSHRTRDELEKTDWVHFCRCADCPNHGFHCGSFAACDAEALVNLGAYAQLSWLAHSKGCIRRGFRTCCCSTRKSSTAPRQEF